VYSVSSSTVGVTSYRFNTQKRRGSWLELWSYHRVISIHIYREESSNKNLRKTRDRSLSEFHLHPIYPRFNRCRSTTEFYFQIWLGSISSTYTRNMTSNKHTGIQDSQQKRILRPKYRYSEVRWQCIVTPGGESPKQGANDSLIYRHGFGSGTPWPCTKHVKYHCILFHLSCSTHRFCFCTCIAGELILYSILCTLYSSGSWLLYFHMKISDYIRIFDWENVVYIQNLPFFWVPPCLDKISSEKTVFQLAKLPNYPRLGFQNVFLILTLCSGCLGTSARRRRRAGWGLAAF
jgi:hypothetical protein